MLSIVFVFWWVRSSTATAEANAEIDALTSRQTQLTQGDHFPSGDTHRRLLAEKQHLEETREAFEHVVREGQVSPPQMTRARFNDYLRNDILPPLRSAAQAATRGGEHGVVLADPDFGMRRYLDGELPESGQLPSLMLFLELMRHYSLLMFDSGISKLVSFEPAPEETTRGERRPAREATTPFGTPARAGRAPGETEDPALAKRNELFEEVRLRVQVKVYEDMLWDMLNRIAADPNQAVVRNLQLTNTNERIWPPYITRPDGRRADRTTAERRPERPRSEIERRLAMLDDPGTRTEEAAPADLTPMPGLASRRQHAAGGELLDVTFELVVYRLKPAAQGT